MAKARREGSPQPLNEAQALEHIAMELRRVAMSVAISAVKDASDSEQAYHLYMAGFAPVEIAPMYNETPNVVSARISNVRKSRARKEKQARTK